jgi:hypothetical protein
MSVVSEVVKGVIEGIGALFGVGARRKPKVAPIKPEELRRKSGSHARVYEAKGGVRRL